MDPRLASWRRIRSMRGRVRSPSTLLGTGTPARSRVRPGRPDATAAGSPSTAATPTSASGRSAPSTRALHARGVGAEANRDQERRRHRRQLGRQRSDAVGRPHRHPLPAHPRSNGLSGYLDSGHNPIAGQWQHLAATYDGTTARYYIDGTEVASRAVSGSVGNSNNWRIGAYGTHPRRLLRRHSSTTSASTTAPSAPAKSNRHEPAGRASRARERRHSPVTLAVTARTQTSVSVAWTPSTDDVGVTGYNLYLNGAPVDDDRRPRRSRSPASPARRATSSASRRSTAPGTSRRAPSGPRSTSLCDAARRVWWRRIRSMRGRVRSRSTLLGTGTPARSRVRPGRPDATAAGSPSTAATPTSASATLGTFYQSAFTLEAWVQKQTATKNDVGIVGSWAGSGPMLVGRPHRHPLPAHPR